MTPVPITMLTAAAAVFVNLWLGSRIVASRRQHQVKIGDGGNEAVLRRMRAQANFIEHAPFFLILLGGLELSGGNRLALGVIAAAFILLTIGIGIGSRYTRATELRVSSVEFCDTSTQALWSEICGKKVNLVPVKTDSEEARRRKSAEIRKHYKVLAPLAFLHVVLIDNRSEFLTPIQIETLRDGEDYIIKVSGYCPDLMFANAVGVTNSAGTVDKFEKVIVGHDKCFIEEIRPIDTKQMKADRKLMKEQLKEAEKS